jgi:hypothetical protein
MVPHTFDLVRFESVSDQELKQHIIEFEKLV